MNKLKSIWNVAFVIAVLLIVNYPVLQYGWYVQDDYLTLEYARSTDLIVSSQNIIEWLYHSQNRFQPVRLFIFTLSTLNFREEYVILLNLCLHIINTLVAYKFLRVFNLNYHISLAVIVIFGADATWRMIESPSAMIGGDGLIFFLMFSSIYLFKYVFSSSSLNFSIFGKYFLSLLLYACAIYSYESAFSLSIIFGASLLSLKNNNYLSGIKRFSLMILPYLIIAITYLIYFRGSNSGYEGAAFNLSADVLTRLLSYSKTIFKFGVSYKLSDIFQYSLFCIFIILSSFLIVKINSNCNSVALKNEEMPIILGSIIYFAAVLLFIINNWQSPKDVMHHHLYIATFGASLLVAKICFTIKKLLKINNEVVISFIVSLFLISSFVSLSKSYKEIYKSKELVKNIRDQIISKYDGSKYVVINDYNLHRPNFHPIMSSMNGALLVWLNNKDVRGVTDPKFINSELIEVKSPLTYYKESNEIIKVKNSDVQMFYINDSLMLDLVDSRWQDQRDVSNKYRTLNYLCSNITLSNKRDIFINTNRMNVIKVKVNNMYHFINNSTIKLNNNIPKEIKVDSMGYAFFALQYPQKYSKIDLYNINLKDVLDLHADTDRLTGAVNTFVANKKYSPRYEWLQDLKVTFSDGFYSTEQSLERQWNWSNGEGAIYVNNSSDIMQKIRLQFLLASPNAGSHRLYLSGLINDQLDYSNSEKLIEFNSLIKPGINIIKFKSDNIVNSSSDPRSLSFAVANFCIY